MLKVVIRRLLLSVPLLLVVSSTTFVLSALTPGDVARNILGSSATPEQIDSLRRSLGLDLPLFQRYWNWLDGVFHGSLGNSLFSGASVSSMLNSRVGVTLSLVIASTIFAGVVGIALGTVGAIQHGPAGRAVDVVALLGLAIPNFWLGLMLIQWFAVSNRIFPASGYVSISTSFPDWLKSIALPVLTLGLQGMCIVAKQTRDAMRDAMAMPFVNTLRASGVTRRSLILKHALRNAAIPVVTVMGLVFIGLLGGTVVVENVFGIPGLGSLAVQAANDRDVTLIQGVAVYFTVIVIAVNLVTDLLYSWLDPRVRSV